MSLDLETLDYPTYVKRNSKMHQVLSRGGTFRQRRHEAKYWVGAGAALSLIGGMITGFLGIAVGGTETTTHEAYMALYAGLTPLVLTVSGFAAYLAAPSMYQQFTYPDGYVSSMQQLPLPVKMVFAHKIRQANRKFGWHPRQGVAHPKKRDDTHNRFLVRCEVVGSNKNSDFHLFIEQWRCNSNRIWSLYSTDHDKHFSADQEAQAMEYYSELVTKASELQNQALEDFRQTSQDKLSRAHMKQIAQSMDRTTV